MSPSSDLPSVDSERFFADLPPARTRSETFDHDLYRAAPDDWGVAVAVIDNPADENARGRHMEVNFVAACAISALKNLCAPVPVPFLFGGDGSVVMVPGSALQAARKMLARVRGFAEERFELALRVGLVPVGELRRLGADVRVGRYEPSPGNCFGIFGGGGVGLLQLAVTGRGDAGLAALAAIPKSLDDREPIDLNGLSSRWQPLESIRGAMLTIVLKGGPDLAAVYDELVGIAGADGDRGPVRPEMLKGAWPPKGLGVEAKARSGRGLLPVATLRVLAETALAHWAVKRGRPTGAFDPARYVKEIATNTGFCKFDDVLSFVLDCPTERVGAIRSCLDARAAAGGLRYGLHESKSALMTCLVTSPTESLHVHFIDGREGGFTHASSNLGPAGPVA